MSIYENPVYILMTEWAKSNLNPDQTFGKEEPLNWFKVHYPQVKESTIVTHIRAMSTNAPSRIHHPTVRPNCGKDLFFQLGPNSFRLYSTMNDPAPIYRESIDVDAKEPVPEETHLFSKADSEPSEMSEFALESHLQQYLVRNLASIETGLVPYFDRPQDSLEVQAGGRRIDILARDKNGIAVVLELKVSRGYDRVIGQLLRYVAWVKRNLEGGQPVRGIVVASGITEDLKLAVSELNDIELFEYELQFTMQPISLEEI